ncbi:GrpB family protein [Desulfovibrio inopinatus]|uniref:GrpB family protein n=1 Tax=Desulfovibrio inopinatus TaxID=102109 RepID=UPI000408F04B|nr:GrpB family protein [Desulfovibrio inopinatus]
MPPPIRVELVPHDPQWAYDATTEQAKLQSLMGPCLVRVHHIGSTSISGIHAKPVIDLIPVVTTLDALDVRQHNLESDGYAWWGELGLPGRRYCTKTDPATGHRLVQLHCFANGSSEITRHLAFRDYLRAHAVIAHEYDHVKHHCQHLHPMNSHDYSDCKATWITRIEQEALRWYEALDIEKKK